MDMTGKKTSINQNNVLLEIPFTLCKGNSILINADSPSEYALSTSMYLAVIENNKKIVPTNIKTHQSMNEIYYTTNDVKWFNLAEQQRIAKYSHDKPHLGIQSIQDIIDSDRSKGKNSPARIILELVIDDGTNPKTSIHIFRNELYNPNVFFRTIPKNFTISKMINKVIFKSIIDFCLKHIEPNTVADPQTKKAVSFMYVADQKGVKFEPAALMYLAGKFDTKAEFESYLNAISAPKSKVLSIEDITETPESLEIKRLNRRIDDLNDELAICYKQLSIKKTPNERKLRAEG